MRRHSLHTSPQAAAAAAAAEEEEEDGNNELLLLASLRLSHAARTVARRQLPKAKEPDAPWPPGWASTARRTRAKGSAAPDLTGNDEERRSR